jgi:hypothetical protein
MELISFAAMWVKQGVVAEFFKMLSNGWWVVMLWRKDKSQQLTCKSKIVSGLAEMLMINKQCQC